LKQLVAARTQELEIKAGELEESNSRLKELDRLKSNFLSTVSHELRTPLTSIRAFSELLIDNAGEEPETRHRFMTIIHTESERLTRLIDDLLDLARIESGRLPWVMQSVNIREIVDQSVQNVVSLSQSQNLKIMVNLPSELPEIRGDVDRLLQVMTNLLGNAIKFTPAGGIIRITGAVRRDPPPGSLEISVSDTGAGIAPEHIENIFQKFFQADSTLTRQKGGSGLGLAISEEILKNHGGRIWVESEPGCGSRFTFSLPLAGEMVEKV
jgi:signal transduction histidine kinase